MAAKSYKATNFADGDTVSAAEMNLHSYDHINMRFRYDPIIKTDDYTITPNDLWKSVRMNAATAKTFTFPSVGTSEDGSQITIEKIGAGKLTLQMVDSDKVHDSSAAGTIYNDQSSETWATITLEYCDATTTWNIISAVGTWTTT